MAGPVVLALLVLQVAGFVVLYVLLRRVVIRRTGVRGVLPEMRAEVDALVTELNSTAERNVALLEDGVRRLHELLGHLDDGAREPTAVAAANGGQPASASVASGAERRAQVLRLRRMGLSNDAIVERLATSPAEVELIVNLADRASGRDPS
jgi:DNA-binding NarL/FixJ family response regulator